VKPDDSYPLWLKVRLVLSARHQNPSLLSGLCVLSILMPQAEVTSRTRVTVALLLLFTGCQDAMWMAEGSLCSAKFAAVLHEQKVQGFQGAGRR